MASDNPPAFPRTGEGFGNSTYDTPGMTLRDWFAGQALGALSAELKRSEEYGTAMRALASKAFVIADAMLAEREKSDGQ